MPLLIKEWRGLKPFRMFIVLVSAIMVFVELFTTFPDQQSLATSLASEDAALGGSILIFLMALALSSGILIREHEDGTIEFLDALPTTRLRIFIAKFAASFVVLMIFPLACTGMILFTHVLSRTSIDPSLHLGVFAKSTMIDACQVFIFLSVCFFLSFCRRFAWLVMGLVYWTYQILRSRFPEIQTLNLFALSQPYFEGQIWVMPWKMLGAQILAAGVCAALAAVLFGYSDRFLKWYRRWSDTLWGRIVLTTSTFLVLLLGVAAFARAAQDPDSKTVAEAVFPKWSPARASTSHYTFVYPSNLEKRAQELIDRADDVYETVRVFMDAPPMDHPISVDLSGAGHQSGLAYWEAIRLDLAHDANIETLVSLLAHETTHVFIERLSNRHASANHNATRFFHEGLASYVETHLFSPPQQLERFRRISAVMEFQDSANFNEMADNKLFSSKYDADAVYPLGEEFVSALVDVCGADAPGKLARAMDSPNLSRRATGQEFWYRVFQLAGYNLDTVVSRFHENLGRLKMANMDLIQKLPVLKGRVVNDKHWVGVEPICEFNGLDGWDVVCRFRPGPKADDSEYLDPEIFSHKAYWVNRHMFPGRTMSYQLGMRDRGNSCTIWEPWAEGAL